jgi:RNA 2',3'-cyclic 3'-phosphodiesterase
MTEPMRLFFAINFTPEFREALSVSMAPLRDAAPSMTWVATSRLHLTVRFLGATDAGLVDSLSDAADRVARGFDSFALRLAEVDAFPNLREPRVVWVGVDPAPRLELMQHDLELSLAALGYEPEGRPFRPHVTVARSRRPAPAAELQALRSAALQLEIDMQTDVESLDLMHSEGGGAVYRRLHRAPVGR